MKLYHFTCIEHWPAIEQSGYLKLTDSNLMKGRETREELMAAYALDQRTAQVMPDGRVGISHVSTIPEEKIVHLTKNPGRSSTELLWATGNKYVIVDKTRLRIEVEVPDEDVHYWDSWHDRMGGSQMFKESLKRSGGDWKSWYISERVIPRAEWVEVVDLDTGLVLWRRFTDDAPVTKDDVQRSLELTYWAEMQGAPVVIMNHRASVGSAHHLVEFGAPLRVSRSMFEDRIFVYLEPEPGYTDKRTFAVAAAYRFYEKDGMIQADVRTIVSKSQAPLSRQRWQDLKMVVSEGIKVAKDGELVLSTYERGSAINGDAKFEAQPHVAHFVLFYLSMMSFLSTTYVVQERRKTGSGPVNTPRGQRRATVESNISVAILRRPEKVAKQIQQRVREQIQQRVREQMEREGKKWMLDHEVSVSGHWRNQYYRSTKTHARIWISDHKKGPEGIEATPKPPKQKVIKAVR